MRLVSPSSPVGATKTMWLFDLISALGKRNEPQAPEPEAGPTKEDTLYQTYIDERKSLVEGEAKSADQFDKTLVTLAGGALGVSLVFLEKIAPQPKPSSLIFLYLSWGGFVVSLLLILASFLTSQYAYRRQRRILEVKFFNENEDTRNFWLRGTQWLNWSAIVVFIFGACMLVAFSVTNVLHKLGKSEQAQKSGMTNENKSLSTNARIPQETPREIRGETRGAVPQETPKPPPTNTGEAKPQGGSTQTTKPR